ncbi:hypothetical protein C8R46DRAFT_1222224 [Mycena filopes]|nr:hypothetical protein C8R46DRAFT_1222224 [Mycena filopes]
MLQFKEFSAYITIDGQPAPEYAVEVSEDERTVTCWIASELGKVRFSVDWRTTSCGPAHLKDLGVIHLTISACQITGRPINPKQFELSKLKVHERSKTAVTQHITLAEPKLLQAPIRGATGMLIGPPLAQFFFKYRPADVLRANGIMPLLIPKPAAEPLREQAPDTRADDEEERNLREMLNPLQETLNSLQTRLSALEAKRSKKETETKPRVKREAADDSVVDLAQTRERKKVKLEKGFVSGEVIDLT